MPAAGYAYAPVWTTQAIALIQPTSQELNKMKYSIVAVLSLISMFAHFQPAMADERGCGRREKCLATSNAYIPPNNGSPDCNPCRGSGTR